LRLKTDPDGDAVLAGVGEQVVELAERADGERAGGFEEDLEDARPVAPVERIGVPCGLGHRLSPDYKR
jgi:hypothetical protein